MDLKDLHRRLPVVLTVAGSDSGGGAGIQADLKTIAVLGGYGLSAITALTAQNSVGVQAVHDVPPEFVLAQLESVIADMRPDAAKTGMLPTAAVVSAVAALLSDSHVGSIVVDPVMISTTGHPLIGPEAAAALKRELFPLASLITPNLHEASALLGRPVTTEREMEAAAGDLLSTGPGAVLVKGGHLSGRAADFFTDGKTSRFIAGERIDTPHTHGSGCVLSAAIASFLARGLGVEEAVLRSKEFITEAVRSAFPIGSGPGPVNPLWSIV